jgi:hypothetical protein
MVIAPHKTIRTGRGTARPREDESADLDLEPVEEDSEESAADE